MHASKRRRSGEERSRGVTLICQDSSSDGGGYGELRRAICAAWRRDLERKGRGEVRGLGLYRGGLHAGGGRASEARSTMDGLQRSRAGKGVQREERDGMRARAVSGWRGGLMGGARMSAGGGEELGYRFGSGHSWASGLFFGWAERFAPASFIFFFSFSFL
jgi:hypothetical protein